jgi:hypothetical protein
MACAEVFKRPQNADELRQAFDTVTAAVLLPQ